MTDKNTIDWPAVEKFIDEYANSYEMIGEDDEVREGTYNPSEGEIYMISDAIRGLLDDEDFLSLLAAPDEPMDRESLRNEVLEEAAAVLDKTANRPMSSGYVALFAQATADEIRALKYQPAQPSDSQAEVSDTALLDWMDTLGRVSFAINGNARETIKAAMRAQQEAK